MVLSMVGAEEQQRVMMPVQTVLRKTGRCSAKPSGELRAGLQERRVMQDRKEEELRESTVQP